MTHVTGPVVLPDGTPAKSRAVLFRRTEDALFALPEGTVVPEIVTARTDAAGAIDVDLLPGAYVVTVPIRQGSVSADIVVPDAAEAVFATLVTNGAIPDAKPAWFDAAIEGATVSVEFPPGVPGQVLGYGPDGSVQAVAGGGYDDAPLTARVAALETEPPPSWGDVTGKPVEFPPAAHTHAWSEVTGKPTTFTPTAHTHAIADVTGLQSALDGKQPTTTFKTINGQAITGTGDIAAGLAAVTLTQAAYDALTPPDPNTLYIIEG